MKDITEAGPEIDTINSAQGLALFTQLVQDLLKLNSHSSQVDLRDYLFERDPDYSDENLPLKEESKMRHNFVSFEISEDEVHQDRLRMMRQFYLKERPSISVISYLHRIDKYTTPSPAVYIASCFFMTRMIFSLKTRRSCSDGFPTESPHQHVRMFPVDDLNVFRLILAVVRLAFKLVEDQNYRQKYYCKIAGLQSSLELCRLETVVFRFLDFNAFVNRDVLSACLLQTRYIHRCVENITE